MPELTLKPDGTLEALVYSRATFEHTCECGCKYTISIDMPEGIIFESSLSTSRALSARSVAKSASYREVGIP